MGDTLTPVLGLTKPEVGASDDTWGAKLNVNMDILDNLSASISNDYVNVTGDTMTGLLAVPAFTLGGHKISIGNIAPVSPAVNDVWIDTT